MKKKYILGINYGAHDTSVALLTSSKKKIFLSEEERFNKEKHTRAFPKLSLKQALKLKKLNFKNISNVYIPFQPIKCINDFFIDYSIVSNNPNHFVKNIKTINNFFNLEFNLKKRLNFNEKIHFVNHHISHILSSLYPSGFKKSICLCFDGMGDFETGVLAIYKNKKISIIKSYNFPHSLGLIYSAITDFLGWKHHCDEGIIMGLAPYGNYNARLQNKDVTYLEIFRKIIRTSKNNPLDFYIDKSWITYHFERDTWVSQKFKNYFGLKRKKNNTLNQNHINIAAALQKRIEEVVIHLTITLIKKFKISNICISGGVGLNCSLNGKILNIKNVNRVFVQPAANDAGTSYGSALFHFMDNNNKIDTKKDDNFFNGKDILANEIIKSLNKYKKKISYQKLGKNLYKTVANLISKGNIIAWVQGKNEFGPRALGNRSILARPYPAEMKDRLNIIKKREAFRPFAPAVLEEYQTDYFKMKQSSFHMLYAFKAKVISKKRIPAAIHIDNTARVQSVNKKSNIKFYKLLKEFYKITKCPVLLNTSLNIKGQPMINYADDAIECMLAYDIDYLVLNDFIIKKLDFSVN